MRDANYRRSWETWLEMVKEMKLGLRLTICYQIVPGLRVAAQLSVLLAVVVVTLAWLLVSGQPLDFSWLKGE